ncbi:MAG: glycerol-3-phosphate 1-O-acyltransferase PlsY [Synergistaceae bacterium]|nr:glycerol-3-phosphate 1-O-acyltransferase PlsY [Synergistaceae bacterium]MBR0095426.1 glycerol-3-phosphate 1-O-acyltransferase PlsY [Synergistaceae bacterium]
MRNIILWVIVSYLIGSLPTGYVVTKLFHKDETGKRDGLDIRTIGSGAMGATNVGRAMGPVWSWFTAIVDMLKGAFALLLAAHIAPAESQQMIMALSAFAVVLGHIFPVWLKFKGGKGVATTYGTLFFIWPYNSFAVILLCGAVWYLVRWTTRYVSLASMLSLVASSIFFAMLGAPKIFTGLAAALALLVIFSHRENIVRLINGKENKWKRKGE